MRRIPMMWVALLSGVVMSSNFLHFGRHPLTLTTTDGDLTLIFPGKPTGNPKIEAEAPDDGCKRTYFEFSEDSLYVNVLVKDCPKITLTAERREYHYNDMKESLERINPEVNVPIATRDLKWSGGDGREVSRTTAATETRLRTYLGKHSAIWMTAIWVPMDSDENAAAMRFIEPL